MATATDEIAGEPSTATAKLVRWLDDWGHALEVGDVDAVIALFHEDSYWRDLVSFSWNIVTVEGHAGIADLMHAKLGHTKPRAVAIEGAAAWADGIVGGLF